MGTDLIQITKPTIEVEIDDNSYSFNKKDILQKIFEIIKTTDLVVTLQIKIGDKLTKYSSNGLVDKNRIPNAIYAVAIIYELHEAIVFNHYEIAQDNGTPYIFNGIYWERIEIDVLKNFLQHIAIKLGHHAPALVMTHGFADTLLKQFYTHAKKLKREQSSSSVLINLQNGTYEVTVSGGKLRAHNSNDNLTYVLPYAYDPRAKAPMYMSYLSRVLPDVSSQIVLQEFHGYVFTRHLKLEKALILYGGGQNGKSVQSETSTALYGLENVATKSLGDLVDRDSGNDHRAKLNDKLLNYGSEIRANIMDVDIFKRLVSGEPVACREKYKTGFDLHNTCKFMFNANTLPKDVEHSDAYFRRFIIIPYTQKITESEKDPELHTKIISSELPGILNWAIEGLHRLLLHKKFSHSLASDLAIKEYQKETNSVALWIEDNGLKPDESEKKATREMFSMYRAYCQSSGFKALSINNFGKQMNLLGFESWKSGNTRGYYCLIGE
ncbi:MAG: phage/plasmid primase, P4 family [Sulfurospirillaceae bacterium]|nr:phage/plasmid primase, P4 family [Sulfurospirillaceae bacterium]